jgi:hypothetical protein
MYETRESMSELVIGRIDKGMKMCCFDRKLEQMREKEMMMLIGPFKLSELSEMSTVYAKESSRRVQRVQ